MGGYTPEEKKLSPNDRLVQSGIAERIIESIKQNKGINDPEITFNIKDCNFRVEQIEDIDDRKMSTQVIVEMPNLHPINKENQPMVQRAFDVEEGGSFGAPSEQPLTSEQFAEIQKILEEQTK